MSKPHVHAEVIKAWAMGATVQYYSDSLYKEWRDVVDNDPSWATDVQYRVKPGTIRYRVAMVKADRGYRMYSPHDELGERAIANAPSFVRWITDWIEVEV